jgi:hypothetical protein
MRKPTSYQGRGRLALDAEEVKWGYRYVLGREPENDAVIAIQARAFPDWRRFRESLLKSDEFRALASQLADGRVTREQIRDAYIQILGREPESADAYAAHAKVRSNFELREILMSSEEARSRSHRRGA